MKSDAVETVGMEPITISASMNQKERENTVDLRLDQLEKMPEKIDSIHMLLVELNTKFDGGPGNWPSCQQHTQHLSDIEGRIRYIERKWYAIVGMLWLASILIEHYWKK